MSKQYHRLLTTIAYALIIASIICNINFYSSFGQGGSSILYAIIGALFDIAKAIIIIALVYMFNNNNDDKYLTEIVSSVLALAILSLLSFGAAFGFLSQINEHYENIRTKESTAYKQKQELIKIAQSQVNALSKYSILPNDTNISSSMKDILDTQAKNSNGKDTGQTVGQITNNCTKNNWYNNRYCSEYHALSNKMQDIAINKQRYNEYNSAVKHYQQLLNSNNHAITNSTQHSMFVNIGNIFNTNATAIKTAFILITSITIELLGSFLLFVNARLLLQFSYKETQKEKTTNKDIQVLDITPNKTSSTTNISENTLPTIINDINKGNLTTLSYRTLQNKYHIGTKTASEIRKKLISMGIANNTKSGFLSIKK